MIIPRNNYYSDNKEDNSKAIGIGAGTGTIITTGLGRSIYLNNKNKKNRLERDRDVWKKDVITEGESKIRDRKRYHLKTSLKYADEKHFENLEDFPKQIKDAKKKGNKQSEEKFRKLLANEESRYRGHKQELRRECADDIRKIKKHIPEYLENVDKITSSKLKKLKKSTRNKYITASAIGLGAGYGAYKLANKKK